MIVLATPVPWTTGAGPIKRLAEEKPAAGTELMSLGWGHLGEKKTITSSMTFGSAPVVGLNFTHATIPQKIRMVANDDKKTSGEVEMAGKMVNLLEHNLFATEIKEGGASPSPCEGDQGGPLITKESTSGEWMLVGVLSLMEPLLCRDGFQYLPYTELFNNIALNANSRWINNIRTQHTECICAPGCTCPTNPSPHGCTKFKPFQCHECTQPQDGVQIEYGWSPDDQRCVSNFIKYKKMDDGQVCASPFMNIAEESQCKQAAQALGLKYIGVNLSEWELPQCHDKTNGSRSGVYFNLSFGSISSLNAIPQGRMSSYAGTCLAKISQTCMGLQNSNCHCTTKRQRLTSVEEVLKNWCGQGTICNPWAMSLESVCLPTAHVLGVLERQSFYGKKQCIGNDQKKETWTCPIWRKCTLEGCIW